MDVNKGEGDGISGGDARRPWAVLMVLMVSEWVSVRQAGIAVAIFGCAIGTAAIALARTGGLPGEESLSREAIHLEGLLRPFGHPYDRSR